MSWQRVFKVALPLSHMSQHKLCLNMLYRLHSLKAKSMTQAGPNDPFSAVRQSVRVRRYNVPYVRPDAVSYVSPGVRYSTSTDLNAHILIRPLQTTPH